MTALLRLLLPLTAPGSLLVLLVGVLSPIAAAQDSESPDKGQSEFGVFHDVRLSGGLWYGYRFRSDEQDEDQDIDGLLDLKLEDIVKDRLDANLSFRLNKDIDGGRNGTSLFSDSFRDLDDIRDLDYPDELYTANVEIHDLFRRHTDVRIGRQYLSTFHGLHIDGIWVDSRKHGRFDIEAFAGRPVSFYSGVHGDDAMGGAVTYRHSRRTKGRVSYYRYDDGQYEDDYADLDLWHRPFDNLSMHTSVDLLEDEIQRFVLTNHYYHDSADLDLWLTYTHLFNAVEEHTIEFSPLYVPLNELDPFDRVDFRFSKGLGEHWIAYGGVSLRESDTDTDSSDRANRDYQLYDLGATYSPVKAVSVSLTGEYWDLESGERFSGITGELEYEPTKRWQFVLGDSYAEYRD
ncbi:MAG: hypothetical protein ABIH23_32895, partial [bacterium]